MNWKWWRDQVMDTVYFAMLWAVVLILLAIFVFGYVLTLPSPPPPVGKVFF